MISGSKISLRLCLALLIFQTSCFRRLVTCLAGHTLVWESGLWESGLRDYLVTFSLSVLLWNYCDCILALSGRARAGQLLDDTWHHQQTCWHTSAVSWSKELHICKLYSESADWTRNAFFSRQSDRPGYGGVFGLLLQWKQRCSSLQYTKLASSPASHTLAKGLACETSYCS